MKKLFATTLLISLSLSFSPLKALSTETQTFSWEDKIIALDAGHGDADLGATYPPNEGENASIYEKDVNLATVYALKARLEEVKAKVVLTRECDEAIPRRKDRVEIAIEKCKNQYGRECDVLVSLHHNGDVDETYDGMMAIYNNKEDFILATYLHDRLFEGLFNKDSAYDEGYDRGGYGMTVYFTPASLTEGYYVTNKCEAELFYSDTLVPLISESEWNTNCPSEIYGSYSDATDGIPISFSEVNDGACSYDFDYGPDRVNQEADALFQGLFNYFNSPSGNGGGGGGNGGDKCPPGKEKQGKC